MARYLEGLHEIIEQATTEIVGSNYDRKRQGGKKHLIGILAFGREINPLPTQPNRQTVHGTTTVASSTLIFLCCLPLAKPSWKLSWGHLYRSESWVLKWDGMMKMCRNENELQHT